MTTVDLVGCDGRVWHLLDRDSPVWLANGLGGLHLPSVTHQWVQTPGKDGSDWVGSQMGNRKFTLPIIVGDQSPPYRRGDEWVALDGMFWEGMAVDAQSILVINGTRRLRIRLDEDSGDFVFAKDPAILGKARYPIAVVAESPAWEGDPVTTSFQWQASTPVNYYGGLVGKGPPFIVSRSNLFTTATIAVGGDLPTPPVYRLTGPAGTVTFGVEGAVDTLPFALNDDDVIIVDTGAETITDSQGNDHWPDTQHALFHLAPLPPGGQVPIRIGMEGADYGAGITVTHTPRYRRAWGLNLGEQVITPPSGGGDEPGAGFGHGPFGHEPFGH